MIIDEQPVRTSITESSTVVADCYYARIGVINTGKSAARNVEVFAGDLLKRRSDGTFVRISAFPSMNLKWSHIQRSKQTILPGMQKHCDLGFIAHQLPAAHFVLGKTPQTITVGLLAARKRLGIDGKVPLFEFELEVKPNHGNHIIPPGHYCIELLIAAENASVIRRGLRIEFTDQWWTTENDEAIQFGFSLYQCPLTI